MYLFLICFGGGANASQFLCQLGALHLSPGKGGPICANWHCHNNSLSCFCSPRANGEAAGLGWVKWWLLAAINFPKGFRGHFLVLVHVVGNLKEGLWHQHARCKLNTKCSHLQKDPSSPQLVTMLLRKRVVEVEVKAG